MPSVDQDSDQRARFWLPLLTGIAVLALDQITKTWAQATFQDGPVEVIGDWLSFRYAENPGAAFSSFTGSGPIIGFIAIGVIVFLIFLAGRTDRRIELVGIGMILGGAMGNLSDRIFRGEGVLDGAVVDWIDWWFIPTFNLADAALNVGVAMLLLAVFLAPKADG
jgi:signal peptidase II